MARTLTPIDVHAVVNQMYKQITGIDDINVIDTSSFISAASKIMTYPLENVLNALTMTLSKTIVSARPYSSPLSILRSENSGMYSNRIRKISFYSKYAQPSGDFNTQLYTNLKAGFDNGANGDQATKSQWVQNPALPLELQLGGSSVWEDSFTTYKYQLKSAFESEEAFGRFVQGWMTEKSNDMEQAKEAYDNMVLLNGIAGGIAMASKGSVVNLTKAYNDAFRTSYTSAQLRTTYLDSFLKFFVAEFKQTMKHMARRSVNFHFDPVKTVDTVDYHLLRHSSRENLRAVLFEPFMLKAETYVLPEIFNEKYLKMSQYQSVDYWQTFDPEDVDKGASINIKPVVVDKSTLEQKAATQAVEVPYVLGIVYDKDYMMTDYIMDDAETTPIEARKRYYNTWYSFVRNGIVDYTENHCIFVMIDE